MLCESLCFIPAHDVAWGLVAINSMHKESILVVFE